MKPLKWQNIQITDNKTDKTTRNHTVDLENRLLDGDEDLDGSARENLLSPAEAWSQNIDQSAVLMRKSVRCRSLNWFDTPLMIETL